MTVGNVSTKTVVKEYVPLFTAIYKSDYYTTAVSTVQCVSGEGSNTIIPAMGYKEGVNLSSISNYPLENNSASFGHLNVAYKLFYNVDIPTNEKWYFDAEYFTEIVVGSNTGLVQIIKKYSCIATMLGTEPNVVTIVGGIAGCKPTTARWNKITLTKMIFNHSETI